MAILALCHRNIPWITFKIVILLVPLIICVDLLCARKFSIAHRLVYGGLVGSRTTGARDGVGSWIPHLCPRYSRRGRQTHPLQWEPPSVDTIFFTQTSCVKALTAREACAVESSSIYHPHRPVLVLLTAPDPDQDHPLLKVLQGLANVRLAWLDLDQVFEDENLRTWHQNRQWMFSDGRASAEVSDAVRAELLRRFGGTYVDLDAITLRPLPSLNNWLGRVDDALVNTAVVSFSPGHPLLQDVVSSIPTSFNPQGCCSIGPNLFTHILHQSCPKNVTTPSSADPDQAEHCNGVTIFPRSYFYPIHYGYKKDQLQSIFREGEGLGRAFLSNTHAFSLHLFHSVSSKSTVSLSGDSILKEVAINNCPEVFQCLQEHNLPL